MSTPLKVMTVLGTRPEIIRLARVLHLLDNHVEHVLVHTGQNYDYQLSGVFFDELGLRRPDHVLTIDTTSLGAVLGSILMQVERVLLSERPDAFLVLGDTNSSIAAIMAKRLQIPVYHMEAGNRSFDANVPEEVNRKLVDHTADYNLVYTEHARRNLLAEGLPADRIILTGSPLAEVLKHYAPGFDSSSVLQRLGLAERGYFLVSAHREENVDEPARLIELMASLNDLAAAYQMPVLVSTHPRTRKRLDSLPEHRPNPLVQLHPPFGFLDFVRLQRSARCVLSDSGTISEESSILGFPAVTLREAIERPEAVDAGTILLTGVESASILAGVEYVLAEWELGDRPASPREYCVMNCASVAVRTILSTARTHHRRSALRPRGPRWTSQ